MIKSVSNSSKLLSTPQGMVRLNLDVFRGDKEEIHDLQREMSRKFSLDRNVMRYSTNVYPTFEFDHLSFTTIPKFELAVQALKKTDRLGA